MSELEDKHREAVHLLEHVGYRWIDGAWELPHVEELEPVRQLSTIDIGDLLYQGVEGGHELWEHQTSYASRHIPRRNPEGPSRPRPNLTVVTGKKTGDGSL